VAAYSKTLSWRSTQRRQLIDITNDILDFVRESRIRHGICQVSVPHATAAILVNENESGLTRDFLEKMEALFPTQGPYRHNAIDDNADSHLAAGFIGHARTFPVVDGSLVRGRWQNIFLVELDGPRARRDVVLQLIGEQ